MKHFLVLTCFAVATCACAAEPFELRDGDRVVLLGNTLIEREQQYGYWETMLTSGFPNCDVTFRNLGWSGDTVWGEARAGFGTPADGFRQLREHVLALKPTVIFVGYGGNEAFGGAAQLPRFEQGLNALLDVLEQTQARIVLLSPMKHEERGFPFWSHVQRNRDVLVYTEALFRTCRLRRHRFVNLFEFPSENPTTQPALTDNGMHLTAFGYWKTAAVLERELFGGRPQGPRVDIEYSAKDAAAATGAPSAVPLLRFHVKYAQLPRPLSPGDGSGASSGADADIELRIRGLPDGNYRLLVDGKPAATADTAKWAAGLRLKSDPDLDQVERLREALVEKNRLYFYRWRPQNETYLFGFRKHEQGQNAREVPMFDPLVAQKEAEIARLRVPVAQQYELVPVQGDKP